MGTLLSYATSKGHTFFRRIAASARRLVYHTRIKWVICYHNMTWRLRFEQGYACGRWSSYYLYNVAEPLRHRRVDRSQVLYISSVTVIV